MKHDNGFGLVTYIFGPREWSWLLNDANEQTLHFFTCFTMDASSADSTAPATDTGHFVMY